MKLYIKASREIETLTYNNERVLTTKQLAKLYRTEPRRISENFNRNKDKYDKRKHYYALTGKTKNRFTANHTQFADGDTHADNLYLWTRVGAELQAKSLGTKEAWESYEWLADGYFGDGLKDE